MLRREGGAKVDGPFERGCEGSQSYRHETAISKDIHKQPSCKALLIAYFLQETVLQYGAFVNIGQPRAHLLHVSEVQVRIRS